MIIVDTKKKQFFTHKSSEDNIKILEQKNIVLQQRIYEMKWTLDNCINLLEKGNNEKALKLLKKVVYEK